MKSVTFEERQVVTDDAFASKFKEYKVVGRVGVLDPGMGEILSQKQVEDYMLNHREVQVKFVPWKRG